MQRKGKILSAGQREDIYSYQFLDVSVIDLPVPISQQVFGLCKKEFKYINISFIQLPGFLVIFLERYICHCN